MGHRPNANASLGTLAHLLFYLLALYNHYNVMAPSMKLGDIFICVTLTTGM